jgi:hypothetical protein
MAYWFKPHRYGYGATPVAWQGVVALVVFPVTAAVLGLLLFMVGVGPEGPPPWRFAIFAVLFPIGFYAFIRLVRIKTDGAWRWRWGRD